MGDPALNPCSRDGLELVTVCSIVVVAVQLGWDTNVTKLMNAALSSGKHFAVNLDCEQNINFLADVVLEKPQILL